MSKTIKYIGTQVRWPELAATGKQSVWNPGQQEERSDAEAALLMATTQFVGVLGDVFVNYAGQVVDKNGSPVEGGGSGTVLRPASTTIALDAPGNIDYAPLTVSGPTTINVTGTTRGASAEMLVVADGVSPVGISGADSWADNFGYLNIANVPNVLRTRFDGVARRFAWSQQEVPSAIDLVGPVISSVSVNGATMTVNYNETLSATPAASSYTPRNAGGAATQVPSAVSRSGAVVTLTLSTPAVSGNTVTLDVATGAVADTSGNASLAVAGQAVTNGTGGTGEAAMTLTGLVGLTNSSGTYTGGSGVAGWAAYGRSAVSLAAGADGWVSVSREIATLENCIIAFHTDNIATETTNLLLQLQLNRAGAGTNPNTVLVGSNLSPGSSATVVGSAIAAAAGVRYRLGRVGAVWTAQSSVDDGATWTVIYTFSASTTAKVYVSLWTTANNAFTKVRQLGLT